MLSNLKTYIVAQLVEFTTSNVFIDGMPDTPRNALMLYRSDPAEPTEAGYMVVNPVGFMIRHSTYDTAESWYTALKNLLHNKQHIDTMLKGCYLRDGLTQEAIDKDDYIFLFTMDVITT